MPAKAADVERMLLKKLDAQLKLSRHRDFRIERDGMLVATTLISHSAREISDPILGAMARQLHVPRSMFLQLIECTVSGDEYFEYVANLD